MDGASGSILSGFSGWFTLACASFLLIIVPLAWWPKDVYGLIKWVVIDIVVIAATAVWIAASLVKGRIELRKNTVNLPLMLLIAWSCLSLWTGPPRYYVWKRLHEMILILALYGGLAPVLTARAGRTVVSACAIIGMTVIAMLGIAQYLGCFPVNSPWGGGLGKRVYATMFNPIFLADFIISIIPLAFCIFILSPRVRGMVFLSGAAVVISFICLLFTVSWGALLGCALSIAVCLFLVMKRRPSIRRLSAMLVVLLAVCGVFFSLNRATVAADYSGLKYRLLYWRASIKMIEERPLAGFGLNSFQPFIPKYLTRVIASDAAAGLAKKPEYVTVYEGIYAHDEYLALLVEMGLIGLIIFIWLIVGFYRQGMMNLRSVGGNFEVAVQAGAIGGVTALLVESIFNYPLRIPATTVSFALLLALAGSGPATGALRLRFGGVPAAIRIILAVVALVCGAALIPSAVRPLIGETLYVEARFASYRQDWPMVREKCVEALKYPITEPETFDLLGESEEHLGSLAGAMWAFKRKLGLKPYDVYANLKLGILFDKLGMEDRAVVSLEKAVSMERLDSAEARVRLAAIMERRGRSEDALNLLKEGLPEHRSDWILRNALGIAYAGMGDAKNASREFTEAKKLGGVEAPVYNMRVLQGKRDGVEARFIGPSDIDWINERIDNGRAAINGRDYARAEGEFQQVLSRYPDYVPALSYSGVCYLKAGQTDRALEIWAKVRRLEPDYRIEIPK